MPVEQDRAAGGHTGRAIVALGCQADVFAVRQPARGDGVVGVDVAQSACAPMGERTGDITDERQASERREGVAMHHRAKHPCPGELLGVGLLPLARGDTGTAVQGVPIPPDEKWHVRGEAVGVGRERRHLYRGGPDLSVGMLASSQKQRAGPRDGPSVLHQRTVDEFDAPAFPLHRGLNLYRLEQHRTQQVDREAGGLKLGIDTGPRIYRAVIAQQAKARGLKPLLAGATATALAAMSRELDMPFRRVSARRYVRRFRDAVSSVSVVLRYPAGPYSQTARPMLERVSPQASTIWTLTGICRSIRWSPRDEQAKQAGVMLLPAVGFDVVPTDCLAAHLKRRLPTATHLARSRLGAAASNAARCARRWKGWRRHLDSSRWQVDAHARHVDQTREIISGVEKFGRTTAMSWGDAVTGVLHDGDSKHSRVFAAPPWLPAACIKPRATRDGCSSLHRSGADAPFGGIDAGRTCKEGVCHIRYVTCWGEGPNDGEGLSSRLVTPEAYDLTALTAVEAVVRVLGSPARPGCASYGYP